MDDGTQSGWMMGYKVDECRDSKQMDEVVAWSSVRPSSFVVVSVVVLVPCLSSPAFHYFSNADTSTPFPTPLLPLLNHSLHGLPLRCLLLQPRHCCCDGDPSTVGNLLPRGLRWLYTHRAATSVFVCRCGTSVPYARWIDVLSKCAEDFFIAVFIADFNSS